MEDRYRDARTEGVEVASPDRLHRKAIAAGNQPKAQALQAMHDSLTSSFAQLMMVK